MQTDLWCSCSLCFFFFLHRFKHIYWFECYIKNNYSVAAGSIKLLLKWALLQIGDLQQRYITFPACNGFDDEVGKVENQMHL